MDTSNHINRLNIENFKSIKSLDISCKRVNVFIGRPNVGKSNILEAMGLFSAQYAFKPMSGEKSVKFLQDIVRFERYVNLFYNQDRNHSILVKTDKNTVGISFENNFVYQLVNLPTDLYDNNYREDLLERLASTSMLDSQDKLRDNLGLGKGDKAFIYPSLDIVGGNAGAAVGYSAVKKYDYKDVQYGNSYFDGFLEPPFGLNLPLILQTKPALLDEYATFFEQYGLELVMDVENSKLLIQKKKRNLVLQLPYSLTADTLKRLIFNLTAIKSNSNSTLVFEEPESHSFPPYIRQLAEEIVGDESNQYFIATHSPYLLNTFIQEMDYKDLGVFVTWYEDHQTKVRELTRKEVAQIAEYDIDLFFNLDSFTKSNNG